MSRSQPFDSVGQDREFRIRGTNTTQPPPPPSSPYFQVSVPTTSMAVNWGNSASYPVNISGQNGFSGPVDLTAQNLPFGATVVPTSVTVPTNGTVASSLTVNTDQNATALGDYPFDFRATSPGVFPVTRTFQLHVLPTDDPFHPLDWLTTSTSIPCNGTNATVASNGTVSFDGSGFAATTGIAVFQYAFTPDCSNARGAIVIGPVRITQTGAQIYPANIYNFGFPHEIADSPGGHFSLAVEPYVWNEFRVATDGSFLVAVSNRDGQYHATLWNMLGLSQINPPKHYTLGATLTPTVSGTDILVQTSNGNDFSWPLP